VGTCGYNFIFVIVLVHGGIHIDGCRLQINDNILSTRYNFVSFKSIRMVYIFLDISKHYYIYIYINYFHQLNYQSQIISFQLR
jgi:hypothetical protein